MLPFKETKRFTEFSSGKVVHQFAEGCFKFEYSGFEVSLSTHEMKPSLHVYSHNKSVLFALDYIDGDAVQQAIDFIDNAVYVNGEWVRRKPAAKINPIAMLFGGLFAFTCVMATTFFTVYWL